MFEKINRRKTPDVKIKKRKFMFQCDVNIVLLSLAEPGDVKW